jgi:hypothetical protein
VLQVPSYVISGGPLWGAWSPLPAVQSSPGVHTKGLALQARHPRRVLGAPCLKLTATSRVGNCIPFVVALALKLCVQGLAGLLFLQHSTEYVLHRKHGESMESNLGDQRIGRPGRGASTETLILIQLRFWKPTHLSGLATSSLHRSRLSVVCPVAVLRMYYYFLLLTSPYSRYCTLPWKRARSMPTWINR